LAMNRLDHDLAFKPDGKDFFVLDGIGDLQFEQESRNGCERLHLGGKYLKRQLGHDQGESQVISDQ